jgi:hypothetical protein
MCLRWSEQRLLLQVLVQQSTERHDSEHRGPAVVAYEPVSWNRGDDWRCVCVGLTRGTLVISSLLQAPVGQSADRHDSEHRGSAVVACAPVSWNRRRLVMVLCLNRFLQGLVQQSTDGHDSEHRGPAVVASGTVSWKRGDGGATCLRWTDRRFRRLCRYLNNNQLSGTIPSNVGQLSLLRQL